METVKCSKCGCEISAISEACPLCGTPTNQNDGHKSNITSAEIQKILSDNPNIEKDELDFIDFNIIADMYKMEGNQFPNHFIGWSEVLNRFPQLNGIGFHEDGFYYVNALVELDWEAYELPVVLPSKLAEAKSILQQYNAIAAGSKYADCQYSLKEEDGIYLVYEDERGEGPKKKGVLGNSMYKQLQALHSRLMECCDFVIKNPKYSDIE